MTEDMFIVIGKFSIGYEASDTNRGGPCESQGVLLAPRSPNPGRLRYASKLKDHNTGYL